MRRSKEADFVSEASTELSDTVEDIYLAASLLMRAGRVKEATQIADIAKRISVISKELKQLAQ